MLAINCYKCSYEKEHPFYKKKRKPSTGLSFSNFHQIHNRMDVFEYFEKKSLVIENATTWEYVELQYKSESICFFLMEKDHFPSRSFIYLYVPINS